MNKKSIAAKDWYSPKPLGKALTDGKPGENVVVESQTIVVHEAAESFPAGSQVALDDSGKLRQVVVSYTWRWANPFQVEDVEA